MALNIIGLMTNNATSEQFGIAGGVTVATTGTKEDSRRVSIATSETTITFDANVGNAGYLCIINRDDTNFVQIGFATTVYVMRLKAGEIAVLRVEPGTSALYCKADTAACDIQFKLFED